MNKIFKVIWSKSKQCYVVVSELAKNTTGKKKIVVASVFAALAMTGGMQNVHAIGGTGNQAGWTSGPNVGTAFDSTRGLVVGPNKGSDTTTANGNVATVAVGTASKAYGSSSVAMGGGTAYANTAGTAGPVTNQGGAIALGWVTAKGNRAVALGGIDTTSATGDNSFAAAGGVANGATNIAIGKSANAGGTAGKTGAVAIGDSATASGAATVAVGKAAQADLDNDNAFGNSVHANAGGATAVGYIVNTTGNQAFGGGSNTNVSGPAAVGIGYMSQVDGNRAVGIGSELSGTKIQHLVITP